MTQTVLSVLREWRCALDEQYKQDPQLPDDSDSLWAGYLADTAQDAAPAAACLDKFCGLEPDWQCPQLMLIRPAMRAALKSLRATPARADDCGERMTIRNPNPGYPRARRRLIGIALPRARGLPGLYRL